MICILQVRSSSVRLKNKAFLKINEKFIIQNVIERLLLSKSIKKIILATSTKASDKKFKQFCNNKNILFFRGPLNNVYLRYYQIIKKYKLKYFLRVTGDSPLIDYRIIDKAFKIFKRRKSCQIVTNTFKRSFPKGQSVEIIKSEILLKNSENILKNKFYKEHITKFFYDNFKEYKIHNFRNASNVSKINLSIDTANDLKKIKKISRNLKKDFKWQTMLRRYIAL